MHRVFFAAALFLAACGPEGSCGLVAGSGRLDSVLRTVQPFTRIAVQDGIQATVARGQHRVVTVKGDDNLLQYVETRVEGERLLLRWQQGLLLSGTFPIEVDVTSDAVEGVEATNGSAVKANATSAPEFTVTVSGESRATVLALESKRLIIDASGSSSVDVSGVAEDVTAVAGSGSRINTDGTVAHNAYLGGSARSALTVRASTRVRGSLSGASRGTVIGRPAVQEVTLTGGSELTYSP